MFLALIRMIYVSDESIGLHKQRCIAHPLKRKNMLKCNDATDYTAKAFAILTYYKIKDDISDEKVLKKMATSILKPIFSTAKNRADMVNIANACKEKLNAINELEKAKIRSVDEPAKLFGELLGTVFSEGLDKDDKLITYTLGFHLGKFIYAADAAEDYEKDRKSGSYNPYVELYDGAELTSENKETIRCALLLECKRLESCVNLLPFGKNAMIENIINNIIYLGLPKRIEFLKSDLQEEGKV